MTKHEKGDENCPHLWYWWDETWSRHGVRRDREAAAAAAQADAAALTARGFQRVEIRPVNIDSRDGFFSVKYSTRLRYTPEFHTCRCAEVENQS